MYFRLPYTESTVDEFLDSLSDYENSFLLNNSEMAYREGYYPEGFSYPDQLVNGTEVPLTWVDDEEATLVKLVGNGGFLRYFDKTLTTVYAYEDGPWMYMLNAFEADNLYYNGYDTNSSCGNPMNMDSMDLLRQENVVATYYACWTDTVDGILVNDEVMFRGSPDDCFHYSQPFVYDDGMTLYNENGYMFGLRYLNNSYSFYPLGKMTSYKSVDGIAAPPEEAGGSTELFPIQSVTVIYNKNQYLTLTSNDFETVSCSDAINTNVENATSNGIDSEKVSDASPSTCYRVKNNNANQALREYFVQYATKCIKSEPLS